jgi:excisionase family DNA binding protein
MARRTAPVQKMKLVPQRRTDQRGRQTEPGQPLDVTENLWSVDDLAAYVGVPRATIYVWSSRRVGPPGVRVGRYLRFRPAEVESWLEQAQREHQRADAPESRRLGAGTRATGDDASYHRNVGPIRSD